MFFNNYKALVRRVVEEETDHEETGYVLDFLDERVQNMVRYVQAVCDHCTGTVRAGTMMRGGFLTEENYRERIVTLDGIRRSTHEVAMASMDQINRLCDNYGLKHICPDDTDRHVRANFCAAVTNELFMAGTGRDEKSVQAVSEVFRGNGATLDDVVKRVLGGESISAERRPWEEER